MIAHKKSGVPLCRPYQPKKERKRKKIAAWDIETEGMGGNFICGTTYLEEGEKQLFFTFKEIIEYIFSRPEYIWLAHNASGYEFAYLAAPLQEMFYENENIEIDMVYQGESRLIQFRVGITYPDEMIRGKPKKVVIDMRDTLCLWPMGLAKVAQSFCPEIPKLKVIDFDKEIFDPTNPAHLEYAYRDSEILVIAYKRYADNIKTIFGSELGLTSGSTALRAFVQNIPENVCYWRDRKSEDFIRRCYYGGLVLPGHQIGEWGATGCIDINAAYGYQMKIHPFPVGASIAVHQYKPDMLGFYQVIATVPHDVFDRIGFNPVPRRDKGGLCWPTGTFDTFISSPEIEYARSVGCTIDVLCGYVFPRTEYVFKDFMTICEEWELKEDGRYKDSTKPQRNSLYGKFGSKQTHKALKFSREKKIGTEPVLDAKGRMLPGLYTEEEQLDTPYMMIQWAALITAYERLYLMKFAQLAYELGASNVYTDTDSLKMPLEVLNVIVDRGLVPVGMYWGEFKLEETCNSFILAGGKCFYGKVEGGKDLKKAKGIPNRYVKRELYIETISNILNPVYDGKGKLLDPRTDVQFIGVEKAKNIFKSRSRVRPINRKRKLTDIRHSYAWQLQNDKIYPLGYVT